MFLGVNGSTNLYMGDKFMSKATISHLKVSYANQFQVPHQECKGYWFVYMKYDVNVEFIPGKLLYIADTLSRAQPSYISGSDDAIEDDSTIMVHTLVSSLSASPEKIAEIQHATKNDHALSAVARSKLLGG